MTKMYIYHSTTQAQLMMEIIYWSHINMDNKKGE
jgi:hypothetical protein